MTRLDAIPFGIVVNQLGRRFYDEGENIWPKRYAIWGGLIAEQPGQKAFCIVDAKTIDRFLPPVFKPIRRTRSILSLFCWASIRRSLWKPSRNINRAAAGNTEIHMEKLDGASHARDHSAKN